MIQKNQQTKQLPLKTLLLLSLFFASISQASQANISTPQVTPDLVRVGGEQVTISCKVTHQNSQQAIQRVTARLSTEKLNTSYQTLYDDGTHGDETAGDGIYSLQIVAPAKIGTADIVFTVVDTDNNETESEPVTLFVL